MKRIHTVLAAALLLAGCIPAQIVRSPDGLLAYRMEKGIAILQPDLSPHRQFSPLKVDGQECEPVWLSWSPDGKWIAFAASLPENRGALCLLNPEDGTVRVLPTPDGGYWFPHWAPDGSAVSYAFTGKTDWDESFECEIRLHSLRDGSERVLAERSGLEHAWTPDGKAIFTVVHEEKRLSSDASGMGYLVRIDVESARAEKLAHVAFGPFTHLRYEPTGGRILFCTPGLPSIPVSKEPRYRLYAFDLGKRSLTALSGEGEHVLLTLSSPSGRRQLVVAPKAGELFDGEIRVSGAGIEGVRTLRNAGNDVFPFWLDEDRIGFQPEGKQIAIHDLRTGRTDNVTPKFPGLDRSK